MDSLEAFAQKSKIKQLVVRFCTLVMKNEKVFRERPHVLARHFYDKHNTCQCQMDSICKNVKDLIEVNGIGGVKSFRDDLVEELKRPVYFFNSDN